MKRLAMLALGAALAAAAPASASTFVAGNLSQTTDLGLFAAGDWRIVATGTVDLVFGAGLVLTPDGTPLPPPQPSYPHFYPDGSASDAGVFGPGGAGVLIGELMGRLSFVDVPDQFHPFVPGFFGYGDVIHLAAPGHIYALINDTFYPNNLGGYSASVERVVTGAVPELATWAMMLTGFFGLGTVLRRRRAATA